MNTIKVIIYVVLVSLIFNCELRSQTNDYVLNKNKPVDLLKLKDLFSIWTFVRSEYPKANVVYSYSCNGVEFCIFELMDNNNYVIFFSQSHSTKVKLKIDGKDADEIIKNCFISHTEGENKELSNRFFGCLFSLDNTKSCEIISNGEFNSGTCNFNINRDSKGWWAGTAEIKLEKKFEIIDIPDKPQGGK